MENNKPVLVAVYGTLRVGHGNWEWALKDSGAQLVFEEDEISGYKIQTFGGYPAIFADEEDSTVVVDVFDVSMMDPELFRDMHGMELGAGYDTAVTRTKEGYDVLVYTMREEQKEFFQYEVPDGDWNKFDRMTRDEWQVA